MYSLARLSLSSSAGAASVAARWITTGPSMQSRKGGGGRKLVVQYAGKREELPVADDFDAEAASTAEQGDGGAAEGEITVRRDMMDALGARFAHVSPEEELDLVLGTVPKVRKKDKENTKRQRAANAHLQKKKVFPTLFSTYITHCEIGQH